MYEKHWFTGSKGKESDARLLVVDKKNEQAKDGDAKRKKSSHKQHRPVIESLINSKVGRFFQSAQLVYLGYRDVIGPDVLAKGITQSVKREVMESANVKAAIEEEKSRNPLSAKGSAQRKVQLMLDRMAADFDSKVLRATCYSVHNILRQMFVGIHIGEKEIERIKEVAKQAHLKRIPLILLPPHKSHVDYLVVSYVFFMCSISLPFIGAGDNLLLPVVGQVLRNCGAFFIRRKFEDDKLYKTVFSEYIKVLLGRGFNIEFFIEGGRSRTGKLLRPKMGLLSVIVEALLSGKIPDALLVPISIGYDRVIETPSYVKELLGDQKEKESIGGLLRSTSLLKFNFGRVDIRIGRPFSLKDYIEFESTKRNLNPRAKREDLRILNQVLAYSILWRINKISITMPTAIVGTALLTHKGRGMSKRELVAKFSWIREQIIQRGGKVATPEVNTKNPEQLVDAALNVLGSLVARQKNVLEPIITPAKRFELSYYRNQTVHLFVNEGIISCGMYKYLKSKPDAVIPKEELLNDVIFLSQLLKVEIIYLPSADISQPFEETLKQMQGRGTISVDDQNRVSIASDSSHVEFDFLCALFWPFIDSYWLMCISAYSLWPDKMSEEKSFLERVQSLGLTLYYQGELNYYESVSKETLSNALLLFTEMNIFQKQVVDNKGLTVLKLHSKYHEESQLLSFIDRIGSYRRLGKYSSHQDNFSSTKELVKIIAPGSKL